MELSPTLFREYDIRGVAGDSFDTHLVAEYEKWYGPFPGVTLTLPGARAIGHCYGTIIAREGGKTVAIGYEERPFGRELAAAFAEGARKAGIDTLFLGTAFTPLVYFAVARETLDGGVMVTGSHNVWFYNGFKMMKKDNMPIFDTELSRMRGMIEEGDLLSAREEGRERAHDEWTSYKKYLAEHTHLSRPLKVVVDCGNGSTGRFAPESLRSIGATVIELYTDPDPLFPHHAPNPEDAENMRDLGDLVRAQGADCGIAFDADGDRCGFVDEKGEFVEADLLLAVLARDVLSRAKGAKILYDVKCSNIVPEAIALSGGIPLMHRTGHAPIKRTMREDLDIILGGELSGHMYFAENYFRIDDGIWAAAKILEIFSRGTPLPFSSQFADFPHLVHTPDFKIPCPDDTKFSVVSSVVASLSAAYPSSTMDGVRFTVSKTGWGLVRASNTSPIITVRIEGADESEVLMIKKIVAAQFTKFPSLAGVLDTSHVASYTGSTGWR